MKRYMLKLEYDGGAFCGWQRQKNGFTVQQAVEDSLERILGVKTHVDGSCRTDAGVHAAGQIAHFDAETKIPPEKLKDAINCYLPEGASVLWVRFAPEGFHARFSAKRKTYVYKLYTGVTDHPLRDGRYYHEMYPVDVELMRAAAVYIVGEHDFSCFMASGSFVKDAVRTVYSVEVSERMEEAQIVEIRVTGNGFLYNMVRIIAGTLLSVGKKRISPDDVKEIILKKDRTLAGVTLPAEGLYLYNVEYDV